MKEICRLAGEIYESDREEVRNAVKRIIFICFLASEEGLLELETLVEEEEEDYIGRYFLKKAVVNLVDGSAPEELSELMTNRILAEPEPRKQFICLLYKTGMDMIASGKNKNMRCVENYISSFFPETCAEEVERYIENVIDWHYEERFEKKKKLVPERFGKVSFAPPAAVGEELKQLENVILEKSAEQVQYILRNTDNFDVCSLLLAGTEAFRRLILNNMSERLQIMIMEDVIERGEVSDGHYEDEVKNIKTAMAQAKKYL